MPNGVLSKPTPMQNDTFRPHSPPGSTMKYRVQYSFLRAGSTSKQSTSTVVEAPTPNLAVRIVEDKHPGCAVLIASIKEVK